MTGALNCIYKRKPEYKDISLFLRIKDVRDKHASMAVENREYLIEISNDMKNWTDSYWQYEEYIYNYYDMHQLTEFKKSEEMDFKNTSRLEDVE